METVSDIPGFSATDRLGLTVFGSLLIHLIVVLGVTFTVPKLPRQRDQLPTLEIILVQTRSDKAPENPDYLAQAHQEGGGESDTPVIARSPLPVQEITTKTPRIPVAKPIPQPRVPRVKPERDIMTQKQPSARTVPPPKAKAATTTPPSIEAKPGLARPDDRRSERTRLSAQISRSWEEYQKRPRRKFLSARTREYRYAAYMDAWRAKIERVGNLNYPERAKRDGLTGNLVLDVALNPDGSINTISIQRPSGFKVLDDAAIRIVKLAAPFAPFPEDIRKETDILHITRTWQFLHGSRLKSK